MNRFMLDFAEVRSSQELHQYFQKVFGLPEYYGHNMDALWDCLSCCYDENTTIVLKMFLHCPKKWRRLWTLCWNCFAICTTKMVS